MQASFGLCLGLLKSKTIYKANNMIENIKCLIDFKSWVSSKTFWTISACPDKSWQVNKKIFLLVWVCNYKCPTVSKSNMQIVDNLHVLQI